MQYSGSLWQFSSDCFYCHHQIGSKISEGGDDFQVVVWESGGLGKQVSSLRVQLRLAFRNVK